MATVTRSIGLALRFVVPIALIAIGALIAKALIASRTAPPKQPRAPRVVPVEVMVAASTDIQPSLRAWGTVGARGAMSVRPTVGGPVVEVHPGLIQGGRIPTGETLFAVDPRDYELGVLTAQAALAAARAELDIELGNAAVAASEWELLDGSVEVTEEGRKLALREPYVARRRADVESAEARVAEAELALERTAVIAPFDALVLSENVELGTQVSAGAEAAQLVDISEFLIEVSVPTDRLDSLVLPDDREQPVEVPIQRASESESGGAHVGRLLRLLGEVDPAGRMARLQVAVEQPLGVPGNGGAGEVPLLLGAYVAVELPAKPLFDAFAIPRAALREGDVLWLADDEDRLELREVDVALRRGDDVLVTGGLRDGERVLLSPLSAAVPGMRLEPLEQGLDSNAGAASGAGASEEQP